MVTQVPVGFKDKLLCQRLDQSYVVGPLLVNREAVLRTITSLSNNRTIYTDDNGYQMMKREYKKYINNTLSRVRTKDTCITLLKWSCKIYFYLDLSVCVYVQNYYPMVRGAYIEDDDSRLVLLSERAHGVASLSQGQIEVRVIYTHYHMKDPFLFIFFETVYWLKYNPISKNIWTLCKM